MELGHAHVCIMATDVLAEKSNSLGRFVDKCGCPGSNMSHSNMPVVNSLTLHFVVQVAHRGQYCFMRVLGSRQLSHHAHAVGTLF